MKRSPDLGQMFGTDITVLTPQRWVSKEILEDLKMNAKSSETKMVQWCEDFQKQRPRPTGCEDVWREG
ncbi:unnamed protein product [Merluccius merluccius]